MALLLAGIGAAPFVANRPVILVFGDSLSAGYGVDPGGSWVGLLERRLDAEGYKYRVVNASVNGETTRAAMDRYGPALRQYRPVIVLLELGGVDGLRNTALASIRKNLETMIIAAESAGAAVVLLGIRIPDDHGAAYAASFRHVYRDLSDRLGVPLVEYLLEGIASDASLMQSDGLHPTDRAQPLVLANVWPVLARILRQHPE